MNALHDKHERSTTTMPEQRVGQRTPDEDYKKIRNVKIAAAATAAVTGLTGGVVGYNFGKMDISTNPTPVATAEQASEIDGLVPLDEGQMSHVGMVLRNNVMNEFTEIRGEGSEDTYNGYGQLMTQTESTAWIRYRQTAEGPVELSYEVAYGLNADNAGSLPAGAGAYYQFTNKMPEAMDAVSDGKLTYAEAQKLFSSPYTEFELARRYTGDRETLQVIAAEGGVVVEKGSEDEVKRQDDSAVVLGLTPVGDPVEAKGFVEALLNT